MSKQTFLKGTIILIAAGLITRVLGFINRIVLARFVGQEGVGLYMMAVPTLVLIITITQFGLPVAISKLVAEADAQGDQKRIKKILVVSLAVTGGLSIVFTPVILLAAPFLSQHLFTDPRTYYPLIAVAPVVPIVAVSSVLRGYFQGKQNMKPAAYSQVLEQIIRISLIAVFTTALLPYGIEYAAAGAMFSSVAGELVSLIYLFFMFKLKKKLKVRKDFFQSVKAGKDTLNDLLAIAIPTTGSRLIGSVSWFFEPIVVAQSLAIAGIGTALATRQYGELAGYALPLLMLPSFVTFSLSTSLVPAISEAMAQKKKKLVEHRLRQALRLSLVTGGLSAVVLYVFAEPLMKGMYGNADAAIFVKLMAPFFIFYYIQGPLQAVLQALNLARAAMINSLIGALAKTALIFALSTRPEMGIKGAALAIVIGMMAVTLLHLATVIKVVALTIYIKEYVYSFLAMAITGIAGYYSYYHWLHKLGNLPGLVTGVCLCTGIYLILLIQLKLVLKEELKRVPLFGPALAKLIPNPRS
ncbi:stage V sporulation protein B [Bacillus sp. FJAT-42376]|uniref:stage V sporulation protein B n=1 Tax=Bacillus sp. FJAT-42376 TaxID=2014076 RepID=UPI000F4E6F48|nr:stage V sporulation protein B [Bacillus sp. FJAT-42376]AZB43763.1 stage V sporulation protein B [Bacillus sp. FJAT-42376]